MSVLGGALLALFGGLLALFGGLLLATVVVAVRVPRLAALDVPPPATWPRVSAILPACDEVDTVEPAVRALLACGYPDLEVVVVDDRSTDGTGPLLDRLAAELDALTVVHLDALPDGWLGKVHALQQGRAHASGALLIVADADTVLDAGALSRAVAYVERHRLDLCTVIPRVLSAGFLADTVLTTLATFGNASIPLWRAADPDDDKAVALGAFSLVRRAFFDTTPGFAWLKLEVADDMGLGLLVQEHGGRSGVLVGDGLFTLRWYASFGEVQRRMQKNFFGILGRFSVARSLALAAGFAFLAGAPGLALLSSSPLVWGLAGGAAAALSLASFTNALHLGRPRASALVPQLGLALTAWLLVRSAVVGARRGGIEWRGKLYPTATLRRAQRVKV